MRYYCKLKFIKFILLLSVSLVLGMFVSSFFFNSTTNIKDVNVKAAHGTHFMLISEDVECIETLEDTQVELLFLTGSSYGWLTTSENLIVSIQNQAATCKEATSCPLYLRIRKLTI
jgi:hypothetical protein